MKTLFTILAFTLFTPQLLADDDLYKKALAEFNSCVMRNMNNENEFAQSRDVCIKQNNKDFPMIGLKFTTTSDKINSGVGFIEAKGAKPILSSYISDDAAPAKCMNCLISTSSVAANKDLSKAVLKTVANQGSLIKEVAAKAKKKNYICNMGFKLVEGECQKQCPANEVFTFSNVMVAPTATISEGPGCKSCDEANAELFANLKRKVVPLFASEDSNDCKDEHGCTFPMKEWDPKLGKCRKPCDAYQIFNYSKNLCESDKDRCEREQADANNAPRISPPSWISKFSEMGCNVKQHLANYEKEYQRHVKAAYAYCRQVNFHDNISYDQEDMSYTTQNGLGNALMEDCASDLGLKRSALQLKIFLSFSDLQFQYPVKPSSGYGFGYGSMGSSDDDDSRGYGGGMGMYPSPPSSY